MKAKVSIPFPQQTSICSLLGHETTLTPNINQSSFSQVKKIRIYSIIHLPPSLPLTQDSLEDWNMSLWRRGAIGQVKRLPHPSHWELQFLSALYHTSALKRCKKTSPGFDQIGSPHKFKPFLFFFFKCHRVALCCTMQQSACSSSTCIHCSPLVASMVTLTDFCLPFASLSSHSDKNHIVPASVSSAPKCDTFVNN